MESHSEILEKIVSKENHRLNMKEVVISNPDTSEHFKCKGKSSESIGNKMKGRRLLQPIQPKAAEDGFARKGSKASKGQGFTVYEEDQPKMTSTPTRTDRYAQCPETEDDCWCPCHHEEQRTAEQEAYELMMQEEVTPEYWKLLAEQRREALDETLEENSQLHDEVEKLREENKSLSEMAQNAEYFASILKDLTKDGDDEDDCENKKEEKEEETVE